MIKILPDIVINRLKAGEVVERPASVIKELVENSLDAKATHITIDIHDGGKKLITVTDNGTGIEYADSDMILTRYATSKIASDDDLDTLASYGFRGEALAAISDVSNITIESKTAFADTWFQVSKQQSTLSAKRVPVSFTHGTSVHVEDLFINTPVRRKYLKSSQTEFFYCYQVCVDFALLHHSIHRTIKKNGSLLHELPATSSAIERITALFKKDRSWQLHDVQISGGDHKSIHIQWIIGDSNLTFGSTEYCKIYVNDRCINDRALLKAIMDGYHRQMAPGDYPMAIISITLPSDQVDVNVHPRKMQVKFLDSKTIFWLVIHLIQDTLSQYKVMSSLPQTSAHTNNRSSGSTHRPPFAVTTQQAPIPTPLFEDNRESLDQLSNSPNHHNTNPLKYQNAKIPNYQILGQLRDMYIVVQHADSIWYVDQHALAERIAFEKFRTQIEQHRWSSQTLLHPITITVPHTADSAKRKEILLWLGFDAHLRADNQVVIYAVPSIMVQYQIDLEKVLRHMLDHQTDDETNTDLTQPMTRLLDSVIATRACKTSIKAWHKLSILEMQQLITDGFRYIPGSFVCQHGRPFVIEIAKKDIDKMFDR